MQYFHHALGDLRHSLKITLPPPGRNPETASAFKQIYFAQIENCLENPNATKNPHVANNKLNLYSLHLCFTSAS